MERMANRSAASVTATQVGSYFVQQYYQMFQQQRDYVHQFYNDSSSMIRVDGDITDSASNVVEIHQLIMSLNFTAIEIKTINSVESWRGGVLVVVSGYVKSRDFGRGRKFVQTFFLGPQEKGYFVLNDMFHFADEELPDQPSDSLAQEQNVDYHPSISAHLPDQSGILTDLSRFSVSEYPLMVETGDYGNSVHVKDEPALEYGYQDHFVHVEDGPARGSSYQYHHEQEFEPKPELEPQIEAYRLEEETPFENSSAFHSKVTAVRQPQPSVMEPLGEPEKLTYASILRAKGYSAPSISFPTASTQSIPPVADWNHASQPLLQQSASNLPNSGVNTVEDSFQLEEGESLSVYVRNLPSTVTRHEILQEFTHFGNIKHDGVFLKNLMDTGVCYAFVEFEDVQGVQNAIKASPIQLAGRKVYIEERRANSGASRGGRSGGRGRGGRGRSFGRGGDQNGSTNNRVRTNGFRP